MGGTDASFFVRWSFEVFMVFCLAKQKKKKNPERDLALIVVLMFPN